MLPYDPGAHRFVVARDVRAATGRSLEAWRELASRGAPGDTVALRRWLMERFGLRWSQAGAVALALEGKAGPATEPPDGLIDRMYGEPFTGLRPIFEHVVASVSAFGDDVALDATPHEVYLVRRVDLAVVRPVTTKHLDLGLALPGQDRVPERFDVGNMDGVSPRITHSVSLMASNEVDREVLHWLRVAYEGAGDQRG